MKFKKGDAIKVIKHDDNDSHTSQFIGQGGVIFDEEWTPAPYVKMDNGFMVYFTEDEIERI